ncbi:MAG TPA: ABC transporter ATP-binding protein [Burkholderiales bacterium]|jgi:ABC-type branched-subunit amino acid transport system ATPase component
MTTLLRVQDLAKHYRGVTALDAVSLEVRAGTITGLIGPNGSGKSTLFDCISGFQRQDSGQVWLGDGLELSGLPPVKIVRAGVRRTFQQLKVFPRLSVLDNLLTSAQAAPGYSALAEALQLGRTRRHERAMRERAMQVLAEIRLSAQASSLAAALSYGQKKLLELGMALMTEPQLLLLDEPVAGVNPALIDELKEELLRIPARGITLFIVEHNLKLVFDICDWIFVLDRGRVLTAGTPEQVSKDERVIEAYLGRG